MTSWITLTETLINSTRDVDIVLDLKCSELIKAYVLIWHVYRAEFNFS